MSWRIVYQGVMIGIITLVAFLVGLSGEENLSEVNHINIGQSMAFIVLALSELVHVYNIRNNKISIFKTPIFNNKKLLFAVLGSATLLLVVTIVPQFRSIFSVAKLSIRHIYEMIGLIFAPIVVVELFKLFKINDF